MWIRACGWSDPWQGIFDKENVLCRIALKFLRDDPLKASSDAADSKSEGVTGKRETLG